MKKKYWKQRALEAESEVAELKGHLMFALLPVPKLIPINDSLSLTAKIEESKEIFTNKRKENNENTTSNCTCINDRITLPGSR